MTNVASQEIKYFCYINGIQVPIRSLRIVSHQNNMAMGTFVSPWSPFLMKLHKGIKISFFQYNSDLDELPLLWFDGTIEAITEGKSEEASYSNIIISFMSDGNIWTTKKKVIFLTEELFNRDLQAKAEGNTDSISLAANTNLIDPTTFVFNSPHVNGDGAKAAAIYLTSGYNLNSILPDGGFYYVINGITKKVGPGEIQAANLPVKIIKAPNVLWSNFMQRYFDNYQLPYKVGYIQASDAQKDFYKDQNRIKTLSQRNSTWSGDITYWQMAGCFANDMECEIISIPNPTYIPKDVVQKTWDGPSETGLLAEFIIKPYNYFGKVLKCNVVFPDQVRFRQHSINFIDQVTRVHIAASDISSQMDSMLKSMTSSMIRAPENLTGYMEDYNLSDQDDNAYKSLYETYFGSNPVGIQMAEEFVRYLKNNKQEETIKKYMTSEFLKLNSNSSKITITVTPDVRVVPGASVLVLDRNGGHLVAFCAGIEYTWAADPREGETATILSLVYPRRYDLDTSVLTEYCNMLEQDKTEIKRFELLVGSEFLDNVNTDANKLFEKWMNDYDCSSRLFIKNNDDYIRDICTIKNYFDFFQLETNLEKSDMIDDDCKALDKMPEELVDLFDTDEEAAGLSMLKYHFYDTLSDQPQPMESQPIKPDYDDIGEYGPIVPSTYASGLIDCHLKYLKRIGNFVSV